MIQRLSGEKVLEALKIAFENDKKTLAYVKGILRNWCSKKLKDFSGEVCNGKFREKEMYVE